MVKPGNHSSLRSYRRNAWRFKSSLGHQMPVITSKEAKLKIAEGFRRNLQKRKNALKEVEKYRQATKHIKRPRKIGGVA